MESIVKLMERNSAAARGLGPSHNPQINPFFAAHTKEKINLLVCLLGLALSLFFLFAFVSFLQQKREREMKRQAALASWLACLFFCGARLQQQPLTHKKRKAKKPSQPSQQSPREWNHSAQVGCSSFPLAGCRAAVPPLTHPKSSQLAHFCFAHSFSWAALRKKTKQINPFFPF